MFSHIGIFPSHLIEIIETETEETMEEKMIDAFTRDKLVAIARIEDEIERGEAAFDRMVKVKAKLDTTPLVACWDEALTMCDELEVEIGAVLIKLRKDLGILESR